MSPQDPIVIDIYARVSKASDERMRSVEGQVSECRARLEELGYVVGEVHIDNSRSAWNPEVRRPGWDRLMERIEDGVIGGVIIFDLARFSRRPIEGERLIALAASGLVVLDSEDSYDLRTANGKKAFREQMVHAAHESDRLSTRVIRGKRAKAMSGEPNHSHRPYGFDADGMTVREDEAEVLREAARRVLAKESMYRIVDDFNERGLVSSRGYSWRRDSLHHLLTRPRNAGYVEYHGDLVSTLPGEPILDKETWEQLRALFASRGPGRPATRYLGSGIARCGRCGEKLYGRPRAHMKPYDDGEVRRDYWCQSLKGGCGRIAIDQRPLDGWLREFTIEALSDRRHAKAVEREAKDRRDRAAELAAEIAEAEQIAEDVGGRLGRGEISLERHDAIVKPLDERLKRLRDEQDALPDEPDLIVDAAATRQEWEERWEVASVGERRELLRGALRGRRLVVYRAVKGNRTPVEDRVRIEDA